MDKDVKFTKRQLLAVVGAVVAALSVQPLVTREDSKAQDQRIAYLEMRMAEAKTDLSAQISMVKTEIIDQIRESNGRTEKNLDKLERRIQTLEAIRLNAMKPRGTL